MIPNKLERPDAASQQAGPRQRLASVEEGHRLLAAFRSISSPDTRDRILRLVLDEAEREGPETAGA